MQLRKSLLAGIALSASLTTQRTAAQAPVTYDRVVVGGRVMDPASGLDGVRNVGIQDGRVAEISAGPLAGRDTIDAHGLVVAPGFIDLHAHGQTPEVYRFQSLDGVTTALELEVGTAEVGRLVRRTRRRARSSTTASASATSRCAWR